MSDAQLCSHHSRLRFKPSTHPENHKKWQSADPLEMIHRAAAAASGPSTGLSSSGGLSPHWTEPAGNKTLYPLQVKGLVFLETFIFIHLIMFYSITTAQHFMYLCSVAWCCALTDCVLLQTNSSNQWWDCRESDTDPGAWEKERDDTKRGQTA